WLSGSAVWNYVAMASAILGIRPDYDGLRIDPCIPADWPGFKATRRFRGATYHITVENPDGRQKGVREIEIDGETRPGDRIPLAEPGTRVEVVARM
ncbi:MAG: glycosyl transferase family 36, partial [Bacteroidetes bacterium]|nr:glycosyl transferase family 36 [Bacteroidota bacterium]